MKLTLFTDLALRLLMYLAIEPGRRATIAAVAAAFGVSEHHLVKVAHALGQAGFLVNVRGRGGGLELALPPDEVSVEGVVRAMEGPPVLAECFRDDDRRCAIGRSCSLRGVLDDALAAFYAVLGRSSLADLVAADRGQLQRILFMANAAGSAA